MVAATDTTEGSARGHIWIGLCVVGILGILLVSLPPVVLDVGLTLNLSLALLLLLVVLYVRSPLELSTFPTILLLATLFRLALNIASTRLILLNGDQGTRAAGLVIEGFGKIVVGGNYIVGVVIFLLFVIINYVVITKGTTRISEVAARFTLDGMPGKQMAIDADLNTGAINETEALRRRLGIQEEADFYGAMDGAAKFVRGDAIAGLLITAVNIIGGLVIGTFQKDMALAEAASTYTLLTVGDGLVSAVPSLLISVGAGTIVTRAGKSGDLSATLANQLWTNPMPLALAAGVLGFLALVPGFPHMAFGLLSAGFGIGAYRAYLGAAEQAAAEEKKEETDVMPERPIDLLRPPEPLELQVGYGLIDLVDPKKKGDLLNRIRTLRRDFTVNMGFPVPLVHIRDNLRMGSEDYAVLIRGVRRGQGSVMADRLLAITPPGGGPKLLGVESRDPTFGLPAFWIPPEQKDQAQVAGYTVVDPPSVIVTHLTELIRRHSADLLGRQQVQEMLDSLSSSHPKLVSEVVPEVLPLGGLQKVLQSLLKETVPVRDLPTILEALGDYAPKTKDPELLTELVRERLAAQISADLAPDGKLGVLVLAPDIENTIKESIQRTEQGTLITLDAETIARIVGSIRTRLDQVAVLHPEATILCSPEIRAQVRRMTERFLPRSKVISANELAADVQVESIGVVELAA
jgi:flagellar biosynthesis protein FlhA